ncbi:CAP domain-containing protein [Salinimicrobium xinjiangense]|uniref:CAP domain-containing protein n=1 Tax=Salinimicrobium xinjiangense TaxID=438596 RepID=UPI00068406A7|nr:CAP domain-containing protein [Salinimicrobium xinjiangense]
MIGVLDVYSIRIWLCCLLQLILFLSCSSEEVGSPDFDIQVPEYSSIELEILDLVNQHRKSQAKKGLKLLDEISAQASSHTVHMIKTTEVCHHNFGSRYMALAGKVGAKAMGENVGGGYRTSEAFFRAWLNSPGHSEIIEGEHTHFGISAKEGKGEVYVTLIFIRK